MIDAAKALTDETQKANLIALAIEFRQVEKNTPPDFTTVRPRPSLLFDGSCADCPSDRTLPLRGTRSSGELRP